MRPFCGYSGAPGTAKTRKVNKKTVSAQDCRLRLFNHKQHASLRTEEEGVVGSQPGILLLIGLQSCGQLACEGFYPVVTTDPKSKAVRLRSERGGVTAPREATSGQI